ncbi:MAG TPA: hypothetical protein ENJ45_00620 [Phaeodactylibacter sp.]|nr:hypothetical protein [Phaeodactylibacter sp.]
MKSLTSFLILCFFLSSSLSAQKIPEHRKDRIRSLRIAFITERLQLTPQEAEKFWPLYNEYEAEKKKLHMKFRKDNREEEITDSQADELVDASFVLQEKELQLKKKYYAKLKKVISPKKLILLQKAEEDFRRKIIREMKRRKQQRGHGNKRGGMK